MRRRGFTLIESVLALAITATIIASVTLLHAYVLRNLGVASARFSNYRQAQMLLDSIDEVATQAQSYSLVTISGGTYLKLVMPASCTDTDNNGLLDKCVPSRLNKRGLEEWGTGKRCWFYTGDDVGAPASGGRPWSAIVSDDSSPSSATALSAFAKYGNGKSKYPNIESMTFAAVGSDSFTVTITSSSNTSIISERKYFGSGDSNLRDSFTVSRTIFTARWRK